MENALIVVSPDIADKLRYILENKFKIKEAPSGKDGWLELCNPNLNFSLAIIEDYPPVKENSFSSSAISGFDILSDLNRRRVKPNTILIRKIPASNKGLSTVFTKGNTGDAEIWLPDVSEREMSDMEWFGKEIKRIIEEFFPKH